MSAWRFVVILLIVALLGWGIVRLLEERHAESADVQELTTSADALKEENAALLSQIQYYKNPENLLKELKSQFNYKESGEQLIIVVPPQASSTEATSTAN